MDYYRGRTEEMFKKMAADTNINPTRPWLEEVLPRKQLHMVERLLAEFQDREDELFQFWFRTYNPEATEYPGAVAASAAAERGAKAEAAAAAEVEVKTKAKTAAAEREEKAEEKAEEEAEAAAAAEADRAARIEAVAAQERRRAAVRAKQTRQVEDDEEQERELRREQKADAVKAQAAAEAVANVTDDEEEESETEEDAANKAAQKAAKKIALEQQCFREVECVLQNDGKPLLMLGITAEADATEIKKSYRSKRALVHPDKHTNPNGHPKATQAFQNLQNAYDAVENLTPEERRDQFGARSLSTQPQQPQQAPSASSSEEDFCGYGNPKKSPAGVKQQQETPFGRPARAKQQQETPFGRPAGAEQKQETPFRRPAGAKQRQETPFRRPTGTNSSSTHRSRTKAEKEAKTQPAKKSRTTKRPKPTKRPVPTSPPPAVPTAAARAKAQAHKAASGLPNSGMYYVGVTTKGTPCQRCCRNCGEQFCSTRHKTFQWMKL